MKKLQLFVGLFLMVVGVSSEAAHQANRENQAKSASRERVKPKNLTIDLERQSPSNSPNPQAPLHPIDDRFPKFEDQNVGSLRPFAKSA